MSKWLRLLVSSTIKHLIILPLCVEPGPGLVCDSQVLLAVGQVFFHRDLPI